MPGEPSQASRALSRWNQGVEGMGETCARVRADPRYPYAVRRFARNMLAAGDEDRLLDGLLKDAGRNSAALCAVYLHYSGGLTLPRLKTVFAAFGLASPGRARALLLYLRYLGYVELAVGHGAGAPARYLLTARFVATWRRHQRAVLEAVQVLEPAVSLVLDRFDHPGVFEAYARLLCESFMAWAPSFDGEAPYPRVFMHRHAGIQIVHALIAADPDGAFPPAGAISFSISEAARRFRVSRIHVRRLLDAAAREELLILDGGEVGLTPAGAAAMDEIFANQMGHFLIAAARTLAERPDLAAPAAPEPADTPPPWSGPPAERHAPLA